MHVHEFETEVRDSKQRESFLKDTRSEHHSSPIIESPTIMVRKLVIHWVVIHDSILSPCFNRCALATNLSTSVRVSHGLKAHAAKCRSFGSMTSAASRDCILRILLRKRLSPTGARSLREARFQCFAGTYLCHVAGRTSNERKIFCMRPFNQGLYNLSALFLRQVVHLGGVFPSSRYAFTAAGGSPSGSSNGRLCAAAPRRAQPMVGHAVITIVFY